MSTGGRFGCRTHTPETGTAMSSSWVILVFLRLLCDVDRHSARGRPQDAGHVGLRAGRQAVEQLHSRAQRRIVDYERLDDARAPRSGVYQRRGGDLGPGRRSGRCLAELDDPRQKAAPLHHRS